MNKSSPTTTPPIPNPHPTAIETKKGTKTTETGTMIVIEIETETENALEHERARDRDREAKRRNRERERDMNSLYQIPHEAHLFFGRSFRAGMDCHEQKKLIAKIEKDMTASRRKRASRKSPRRPTPSATKRLPSNYTTPLTYSSIDIGARRSSRR
ncbi:hypothetical protein GYH30_042838 [Glycine max]|nr:hypothetical protein GYH30_042838 [Glycine max]